MRRWWLAGGVVLLVVAAATFVLVHAYSGEAGPGVTYTEATVESGTVEQTVFGYGTVEPVEQHELWDRLGGTITSVSVKEGDRVEAGDELLRVDGLPVYALESGPPFSVGLSLDEDSFFDPGFYEEVMSVQEMLAHVGLYDGAVDGEYDVETLRALRSFLEEGVEEVPARTGSETFQVVGEDARVVQMGVSVGDVVTPGDLLLVTTVGEVMQTVLRVNEIDMPQVAVGQRVELTVDAFPGEVFSGRVTEVSYGLFQTTSSGGEGGVYRGAMTPGGDAGAVGTSGNGRGIVEFPVTVVFDEPVAGLLAGMSVDGDIVVAEAHDVLVVPAAAVFARDGVQVVFVVVPGEGSTGAEPAVVEVRPVVVEVGMRSDSLVEIRSGLVEGQRIVAHPVAEGDDGTVEQGGLMPGGIPGGRMSGVREGIEGLGGGGAGGGGGQ